jgi:hypothetical protein
MKGKRFLYLRVGDRVKVRSLSEILATLDGTGKLDGLPFMPEMFSFCGREFTVLKRIDKINDTVDRTGLRRMNNAVILDGVLCNGAAHGGCEALCQTIWKEAWLVKLVAVANGRKPGRARQVDGERNGRKLDPQDGRVALGEHPLVELTRREVPGGVRYICQATELKRASAYLAWWDPRQYVKDLRSGNVGVFKMIRVFLYWIFAGWIVGRMRGGTRLVPAYNFIQKLRGGEQMYLREGALKKTPGEELDLQCGELVQVKSYEEILETLDQNNKNRGMRFDVEMVKYCGATYPVLARVNQIIDHHSGKMLKLPTVSIILKDVTVQGDHHRFYPQNEFPFWREIWLRRVLKPAVCAAREMERAHS